MPIQDVRATPVAPNRFASSITLCRMVCWALLSTSKLIVGDEAAFAINGEVCTHNVRQYAPNGHPSEFNFERNVLRHVWAAICGNRVILGPYFFNVNVTGIANLHMLN